jgi:hypothetical protein
MGTELLNQLQDLRMRSLMSDQPCAELVHVNAVPQLLVSVGDWVFTKNQFVMLWFWLVTGTRAYSPQVDHAAWNVQIAELNPDQVKQVPVWARDKIMEYMIKILPSHYKTFTPDQHKQVMRHILTPDS